MLEFAEPVGALQEVADAGHAGVERIGRRGIRSRGLPIRGGGSPFPGRGQRRPVRPQKTGMGQKKDWRQGGGNGQEQRPAEETEQRGDGSAEAEKEASDQIFVAVANRQLPVKKTNKAGENNEKRDPVPYTVPATDIYAKQKAPEAQDGIAATVCDQDEVKRQLKSARAADFPFWDAPEPTIESDGSIRVESYVDTENRYGALVRTYYSCKVIVIDAESGNCTTECNFTQ